MKKHVRKLACAAIAIILTTIMALPAYATDTSGKGGNWLTRLTPEETMNLSYKQGDHIVFTASFGFNSLLDGSNVICGLVAYPSDLEKVPTTAPSYSSEHSYDYVGTASFASGVITATLDTSNVEPGRYVFWLTHQSPGGVGGVNKSHIYQTLAVTGKSLKPAPTATPTTSTVLVNGQPVSFDAYNIEGSNYFKLRDLAYALNGTEKQFDVSWDQKEQTIWLTSGQPYTAVGGEMAGKGDEAKTAVKTTARINLDYSIINVVAYNIDGNNYFRLRDVGMAFNFRVDWDGENNTVIIDTSKEYKPE